MKLSSIFTDHMVIQQGMPIRIFGEGKGKVTVDFLGKVTEYISEEDKWCITYPEESYGGPYDMKVTLDDETVILKDIYIGEVWIASGQSNMEMPLFRTEYGINEARHSKNDMIRLFTVSRRRKKDDRCYGWHFEKTTGEDTPWQLCNEDSSLHFSAMGYYVAKELQEKLGVAVGVISLNWGGMPIDTFIKREYFNKFDCLKPLLEEYNKMVAETDMEEYEKKYSEGLKEWEDFYNKLDYDEVEEVREKGVMATTGAPLVPTPQMPHGPYSPSVCGCLYDSMTSRIAPYGIKGVLWYQGESNQSEGYLEKYLTYMDCMKDTFKNKDLKFYATELASFSYFWHEVKAQKSDDRFVTENNWAFTREAQQKATEVADNNYLVTSMGLGDLYDIHPFHKRELAHRMSLKVLKYTYGFDIYADQPLFKSAKFEGSKVFIKLDNSDGLNCRRDLCGIKMFVADESKQLKKANVEIVNDGLVLTCDEVKNPTIVRYAFDFAYSGCHIFNKAGLPLAPFRTDKD